MAVVGLRTARQLLLATHKGRITHRGPIILKATTRVITKELITHRVLTILRVIIKEHTTPKDLTIHRDTTRDRIILRAVTTVKVAIVRRRLPASIGCAAAGYVPIPEFVRQAVAAVRFN